MIASIVCMWWMDVDGIIVEDYMNVVDVPPLLVYKNVVNVV